MIGMGFAMDVFATAPEVPVLWSPLGPQDDAEPLGDADGTVLFQTARRGVMPSATGTLRFAMQLQVQRDAGGRLTAVMIVATLTGHARWALHRVAVPVHARHPQRAAAALRSLLPDILNNSSDGTVMLSGADGIVQAEIASVSGKLAQSPRTSPEPRRSTPRLRTNPLHRPAPWTWSGSSSQKCGEASTASN